MSSVPSTITSWIFSTISHWQASSVVLSRFRWKLQSRVYQQRPDQARVPKSTIAILVAGIINDNLIGCFCFDECIAGEESVLRDQVKARRADAIRHEQSDCLWINWLCPPWVTENSSCNEQRGGQFSRLDCGSAADTVQRQLQSEICWSYFHVKPWTMYLFLSIFFSLTTSLFGKFPYSDV